MGKENTVDKRSEVSNKRAGISNGHPEISDKDPGISKKYPEISNKRYRQYKLKLRSLERANYDTVMMIPCAGSKNWHELAEHSALIYYYEVCAKMKRKVRFFVDVMSLYNQYEIGYIRSLGVGTIRENLKAVGLYKSESKEGDLITFQLNTRYSREKIQELYEAEMTRRRANLTPEPTGLINPVLHQMLTQSSSRLHGLCNQRLDKLSSQTNGAEIVKLIDGMLERYHQVAMMTMKQRPKIVQKYTEMRKAVYELVIKIRVLGDAKLWDLEVCASVTEPLEQARSLIEEELGKLLKQGDEAKTTESGSAKKTEDDAKKDGREQDSKQEEK